MNLPASCSIAGHSASLAPKWTGPQHPDRPTWYPLPHRDLVAEVEWQLESAGFQITGSAHALSHEGSRYFGVLQIRTPDLRERDYGWVVGLRNSHDKSLPAGLVAGSHVLCCDNLAFAGEIKVSRKHTKFAVRDLRHLTSRAVGQLEDRFRGLDERIACYRAWPINDAQAHDLIIRAVDCRAITVSQVPDVVREWREPSYDDFRPRSLWSLFNAVTEVHKHLNPHTALARGEALHGLFDGRVGLN